MHSSLYLTNMDAFDPQDMPGGWCYYYPHWLIGRAGVSLLDPAALLRAGDRLSAVRPQHTKLLHAAPDTFLGWSCNIPDVKGTVGLL